MKLFDVKYLDSFSAHARILLLFCAIWCYCSEALISPVFAILVYIFFGMAFIKFYYRDKNDHDSEKLFLVVFSLYIFYALCFRYFYQASNLHQMLGSSYGVWDDQVKSYLNARYLSQLPFFKMVKQCFSLSLFGEYPLYCVLLGCLGKIASGIDSCNYTFLLFHVTFLSSLIPVFLYKICLFYFKRETAYKVTMFYAIFSFTLFFSARLLRDEHIAFIYIWAMYLICNSKKDVLKLVQLGGLAVICYYFRVEHGYFMLVFIGIFLQLWLRQFFRNSRVVVIVLSIVTCLLFTFYQPRQLGVDRVINTGVKSYTNYESKSLDYASVDSFGKELMRLPKPLNYFVTGAWGQIQPFPFWVHLGVKDKARNNWIWFPKAIAGIFWFFAWGYILKGVVKKPFLIKSMPPSLIYLCMTTLLLILLTTAEFSTRRIYCAYPPLYLLAVFSYLRMSATERRSWLFLLIVLLVSLHVLYSFMKIMQGNSPI